MGTTIKLCFPAFVASRVRHKQKQGEGENPLPPTFYSTSTTTLSGLFWHVGICHPPPIWSSPTMCVHPSRVPEGVWSTNLSDMPTPFLTKSTHSWLGVNEIESYRTRFAEEDSHNPQPPMRARKTHTNGLSCRREGQRAQPSAYKDRGRARSNTHTIRTKHCNWVKATSKPTTHSQSTLPPRRPGRCDC